MLGPFPRFSPPPCPRLSGLVSSGGGMCVFWAWVIVPWGSHFFRTLHLDACCLRSTVWTACVVGYAMCRSASFADH